MSKLVSVVIPIYNVEKYLRLSVLSVLNQTYKNIEIILVNDGSTDSSYTIASKLAKIDNRIKLHNKKNGGLSDARNFGIDKALGKYICFIDSDDWIEPDFIEVLVEGIETKHSDIAVIQMKKISNINQLEYESKRYTNWDVLETSQAMACLFTNNLIGYSANNKLYQIKLFKEIRYPKGMLMEDKATTYRLIDKSKSVAINQSQKYHYYQRAGSILNSKFNDKRFDSFIIHEEIINFIDENYPDISIKVHTRYVREAIRMMMSMIETKHNIKSDYDLCIDIVRNNEKFISEDSDFSKVLEILAKLLVRFPSLPYLASKSYLIRKILNRLEML